MFKLAKAKIWHKRLKPKVNEFNYKVFYICVSLDEIDKLPGVMKLNRRGVLSFYDKDHGARDGSSLKPWINNILSQYQIEADDIILLTYPRVLGYVFNPVSLWYCLKNGRLVAVLAEVNNTFGESHNYLIFHADRRAIMPDDEFVSQKDFHVSPFIEVAGTYTFRFGINENNCFGYILHGDGEGKLLETLVNCRLGDLTKKSLSREFNNSPFMTLMVIMLIHWQALKLFFKRVKYNVKPKKKDIGLTIAYGKEQK
jgi:DUF1365 family protein